MDSFIDSFAHFCLKFGHITFILPVLMILMIFHRRDIYAKAACFLLWVMIFNTLLKQLFKVPLFPHLGNGYAFPSGHMHASCAFYGYILYKTHSKFIKAILGLLLTCIGFSLIHCQFHDWLDVLGAVGFAVTELSLYHILSVQYGDKVVGFLALFSALVIMSILDHIYKVQFHVWLAFYGLLGMELSLTTREIRLAHVTQKFLVLLLSTLGIYITYYIFKYLDLKPYYLSEIRFALLAPIIVSSIRIASKFKF